MLPKFAVASVLLLWSSLEAASQLGEIPIAAVGLTALKLNELFKPNGADYSSEHSVLTLQDSLLSQQSAQMASFKAHWFEQPLDHFSDTGYFWKQRYWFSDRHYTPGGPVIVLDGGETSGVNRLPFLDTGIVNILANATGGLGVILEHRYYGKSIPVSNFSTDSLRWLNNAQAAADSARFMQQVVFAGISANLTAPSTPWIYYGGSYAGARAAHMRILYPHLVYGAIASSAVTHAQISFPEYNEIIRKAAPGNCSLHISNAISLIDFALTDAHLRPVIKRLFGLQELSEDVEFAAVLQTPLHTWQSKVWDPEVGSTAFDDFCNFLERKPRRHDHYGLMFLDYTILNYAQWIRENVVAKCPKEKSIPECFSPSLSRDWEDTSTQSRWRLWFYQVCTEWGYFISAPEGQDVPRIVSRLLTTDYLHSACEKAFPPGSHNQIPVWPNISAVNDLGDFTISADRLAFIDGEVDPWRPATPHSDYAKSREDSLLQPYKLINNAVHHYDEYGLSNIYDEPPEILAIHLEMIEFVQHWLREWNTTL